MTTETGGGRREFARFREGGQLIAEGASPFDQPLTLTVALRGGRLGFDYTCHATENGRVGMVISINGIVHSAVGPCSPSSGSSGWERLEAADLARFNLSARDPVPITVTIIDLDQLRHFTDRELRPSTVTGTFRLAVYDYIGPDAYPYPDPPPVLTPLVPPELDDIDTILNQVRADPADPRAPRSMEVSVQQPWTHIDLRSQTPGRLTVTVDGQLPTAFEWWDYDQAVEGLTLNGLHLPDRHCLREGDTVTITITPERTTGDWLARARQQS